MTLAISSISPLKTSSAICLILTMTTTTSEVSGERAESISWWSLIPRVWLINWPVEELNVYREKSRCLNWGRKKALNEEWFNYIASAFLLFYEHATKLYDFCRVEEVKKASNLYWLRNICVFFYVVFLVCMFAFQLAYWIWRYVQFIFMQISCLVS